MSGDNKNKKAELERRLNSIPGVIVSRESYIIHPYVSIYRISSLGGGSLEALHGIIVHQTGGATVQSALIEAGKSVVGAHFYIDKDGSIYQTASLFRICCHVGCLKPRCLIEHRCVPAEEKRLLQLYNNSASSQIHKEESRKTWPDRYPMNRDSIGIELVGSYLPKQPKPGETVVYDVVTDQQNASLKWLIQIITKAHATTSYEIFRHPDISRKMPTEASTAKW